MDATLTKGDQTRKGVVSWEAPVDVPAVIDSEGSCLYWFVWEYNGWTVTVDDPEGKWDGDRQ